MSTPLGTEYGKEHGEEYGKVIEKWGKRLKGVKKISPQTRKQWGADLYKALGSQLEEALIADTKKDWEKIGNLPSDETIRRFAQTATKKTLEVDSQDLLDRLREMTNRSESEEEAVTAAAFLLRHALMRTQQTMAQVFDMAKGAYNFTLGRFFTRQGDLTGRKRWQTHSENSRHAELDGDIVDEGESFNYKGQAISGPRPPGGSPENWSNCSCTVQFERKSGEWVSLR